MYLSVGEKRLSARSETPVEASEGLLIRANRLARNQKLLAGTQNRLVRNQKRLVG